MSSISQVADALKRVLTTHARKLERETDFVQRSTAQLDGPIFAQTTVFGWMDNAEASYPQLRHVAASLGVSVSTQAVEQRFGVESAALLRELLQEAVGEVLSSEASAPELLRRFNGVYVQDGTIISLPPGLRDEWRGCGGSTPEAGRSSMRVQVSLGKRERLPVRLLARRVSPEQAERRRASDPMCTNAVRQTPSASGNANTARRARRACSSWAGRS